MLKPDSVTYVLQRMNDCPDLAALRCVWDGLNPAFQSHPLIRELKDRLKETLK